MTLLGLVLIIAIIGFIVWLIGELIPMEPRFKTIINVIAGIIVLIIVLNFLGINTGLFPNTHLY